MEHLVSIHGGHSGKYCNHAKDSLEDIIKQYVSLGYKWVGITEHVPPMTDAYLYPDEIEAGLHAKSMYDRFAAYFDECRKLKEQYASQIKIYTACEVEIYTDAIPFMQSLLDKFNPDYFVGSVHHVRDVGIDYKHNGVFELVESLGGWEALYCEYFDMQMELIEKLNPPVIGHFDVIRIADPDYHATLQHPGVQEKIERNLQAIKDNNLIMDLNVCAFRKGANEPYISEPILQRAKELGIAVMPGDDSHGIEQVGAYIQDGIRVLEQHGFDTSFNPPF